MPVASSTATIVRMFALHSPRSFVMSAGFSIQMYVACGFAMRATLRTTFSPTHFFRTNHVNADESANSTPLIVLAARPFSRSCDCSASSLPSVTFVSGASFIASGTWLAMRLLYSSCERWPRSCGPSFASIASHASTPWPSVRLGSAAAGSSPSAIRRCLARWSSSACCASRFVAKLPT